MTGLDGQLPQSVASPRLSLTWLRSVNLHPADHPWKTVRLLPTNEKLLNSSYRIRGKVIKMNKLRIVFAIAMICLVVSTAYAAFLTSNPVIGEVKESGLHLDLEPSPSVIYLDESFILTATLTPHVQDRSITFYWNGTNPIGSDSTDALGIASISFTPSVSGNYTFTATCTYP